MGWLDGAKRAWFSGTNLLNGTDGKKRQGTDRRNWSFETLEPRLALSGVAAGLVPIGEQPEGTLSGKIVYTSAGHGWNWNNTLNRWATDRPNLNGMVEDFGNQDQMTLYADYLLRAGATVVPMRPVGRQLNEVVLDNNSPGVTFEGAWSNNITGPRWYDANYASNATIKYRFSSINSNGETATATYTPNIPESGFYPVYTWVHKSGNRTDQLYRINHTGGSFEIRVDHRMVGDGWVYLGTYHFDAGSSAERGSVQISNYSTAGGNVVIADSIRFGNGMGDVPNGPGGISHSSGTVSGHSREDENALHWLWRGVGQGVSPSSVIGTSHVSAPARMAEHMNADSNPFGTSVYIGFHSNAFNGQARGAVGLVHSSSPTPNQSALATFTARQIDTDMRALDGQFEHNWVTRPYTLAGGFGEINANRFRNSAGDVEMDGTIIETAFHDNVQDAQLMRDPKVRDQMGRSTYEATLEYFMNFGGATNITLPSAPTDVSVVSNAEGEVTVSWAAGPSSRPGGVGAVHGDAATGFVIYASTNGYGFDGGTFVAGGGTSSATLTGYDPDLPYYFKVAAVNPGGQSHASEVLTVLPSGGEKQVLIVGGFDRHDRFNNFRQPYAFGGTFTERVWPRYNNSFDYVVEHHSAIHAATPGVNVESTSNEAVIKGDVDLTDYHTVVWILGNESTADSTFDATEQTLVEQFIAGGGNLFVSGSEIGWDLDAQNNGRAFYNNTLMASHVQDGSNTYNVGATPGGIFAGMPSLTFSDGAQFSSLDGQYHDVRFADVISPQPGAQTALTYVGGSGGGAAIQAEGTGGRGSVVMLGFPFEAITSAARRQDVMDRVFDFFGVAAIVPDNADFNGNGVVDAADYTIWRDRLGQSVAPGAPGDANHDGLVNQDDYQIWKAQFGSSPGTGAASEAALSASLLEQPATAALLTDEPVEPLASDAALAGLGDVRASAAGLDARLLRAGVHLTERPAEIDAAQFRTRGLGNLWWLIHERRQDERREDRDDGDRTPRDRSDAWQEVTSPDLAESIARPWQRTVTAPSETR